jgi:UDP-N-acetylmuramoylalanine--D-glutamate ligase
LDRHNDVGVGWFVFTKNSVSMTLEITLPATEVPVVESTAIVAVLTPLEYAGRTALVVGLGESGTAMARWLSFKGASLRLADTRNAPPGLDVLKANIGALDTQLGHSTALNVHLGAFSETLLDGVDVVAWSPGLSTEMGESAKFYQTIIDREISVIGELDLFAQAIADLGVASGYSPKVIAVTGTNGKTTTVRLVHHLCEAAGKSVVAAGNISPSLLDALFDAMQANTLPEVWAIELSSFQLSLAKTFSPSVATILNLSQNHLDWHETDQTYEQAKRKVMGAHQTLNTVPLNIANAAVATTRVVNRAQTLELYDTAPGIVLSFGTDQPSQVGEFGLVRDGGLMWLAQGLNEDGDALPNAPIRIGAKRSRKPVVPQEVVIKRLMPADALKIRGRHNQLNALAALALCTAVGIPMAAMLHGLRSFSGEPHRCQLVRVLNEIEYYNDSKATTIAATVAALSGLDKPSVLIAGGKGKGQDFSALAQAVREHAKAVFLIGVDAPLIAAALGETGVELVQCASLEEAVEKAQLKVRSGEVVLLSPACASLDMFANYEARGYAFQAAVEALQ